MSKVVVVKYAPATATLPPRCVAQADCARVVTDWNYNLSDSANYRYAANALVRELNLQEHSILHGVKWQVCASGTMPDGTSTAFIITE